MADKYLDKNFDEVAFSTSSSGVPDAGKGVGLNPDGKIDQSMMPVGVGPTAVAIKASEDISAGNFVNIFDDAGTLKIRKADNTSTDTSADGFVNASVVSGANGTVYFSGALNTSPTPGALTIGKTYYLGTSGDVTDTPPTIANSIIQPLGKALSTSKLIFNNVTYRKLS